MDLINQLVNITDGEVSLEGELIVPADPKGIILFAHGSGSSRHSPRNQYVAQVLQESGIGTLLFDLLTAEEDTDYNRRFDIPLLTNRLVMATEWLQENPQVEKLPVGYFGASTGAAAALLAAAEFEAKISCVISRGGRPDMAEGSLDKVQAPTLLLVGGLDDVVIELNQKAYDQMRCEKELKIVPGATHLFEEPGTLEQVAQLARDWCLQHLTRLK